jgi:transcriptional regulator with XRE-family HTH domain
MLDCPPVKCRCILVHGLPHGGTPMADVKRAGLQLRRIRDALEYTTRQVQELTNGQLIAQQLTRIEKGQVERPTMRDLCLIANTYRLTPNYIAELYGYWQPTEREEDGREPEDARITYVREVVARLPTDKRERLLRNIKYEAVVIDTD